MCVIAAFGDLSCEMASALRMLDMDKEDGEERSPLAGMFPATLPIMPLAESLAQAAQVFPKLQPDGVLIKKALRKAGQIEEKFPHMSVDKRAAIVLYTMEDTPREQSPYYAMNEALRAKDRSVVRIWRDYIWLLLHALKELPPSPLRQVVRGCKRPMSFFGLQVKPGKEITWSSFSSTAHTVDVMQTFLGETGPRVLFIIELVEPFVARDVQEFSLFPGENELLLPPNVSFEVKSKVAMGGDLHIIQYKQIESLDSILDLAFVGNAVDVSDAKPSEVDQLAEAIRLSLADEAAAEKAAKEKAAAEMAAAEKAAKEKAVAEKAASIPSVSSAEIDAFMKKVGSSLDQVKTATELDWRRKSLTDSDTKVIAYLLSSGLAPKLQTLK